MTFENDPTQHQPPAPPAKTTNVLAIVALVASFFVGLAGVICGIIALTQVKRTGQKGRGLAIAGIAVGGAHIVVSAIVSVTIIASAALLGASSSVARSLDTLPDPYSEPNATLECADLQATILEGSAALREAGKNAATDPQAGIQALSDFSAELEAALEDVDDPEIAAAGQEAVTELDDYTSYLSGIADDPSSVTPEVAAEAIDRLTTLSESLQGIATACTAAG